MQQENANLLIAEGISKHFGGTKALDNISFSMKTGEIHALMGENGAGKSTLGKILAGIYRPDSGTICFEGQKVHIENPREAKKIGISIVLQEFNLLPDLSVAENLVIGNNKFYKFHDMVLDKTYMYKHARELLDLFGLAETLDVYDMVKNLSIAQMQILEILKAVDSNSKIIILDEPTATLSPNEVKQLFAIVRRLQKEHNMSFIIVSHKIEEIFEIAERVTVLRDGKEVLDGEDLKKMTENSLVKSMVGREITDLYGSREFGKCRGNEVVFKAENICDMKGRVKNISLELRKGEIVGLTGIVGAGRTEFCRCIFGIDKMKSGRIFAYGKEILHPTIRKVIEAGLGMVPEDRKNQGLILNESIMENISIVKHCIQRNIILSTKRSEEYTNEMKQDLRIKVEENYDPCDSLSGGNQQKVLLGKWLIMDPGILIIDEPTRGIDISAKSEIYAILNKLSSKGMTILMVSSEMPEIIGMCDRIIIMREGIIAGELNHDEVTEQRIATLATINVGGNINE